MMTKMKTPSHLLVRKSVFIMIHDDIDVIDHHYHDDDDNLLNILNRLNLPPHCQSHTKCLLIPTCDHDDEFKAIFSGKPSLRESRVRLKALFDYNPFVS